MQPDKGEIVFTTERVRAYLRKLWNLSDDEPLVIDRKIMMLNRNALNTYSDAKRKELYRTDIVIIIEDIIEYFRTQGWTE